MNFTILDGSDAGQTFILGEEPILVGREEGGVRITDDRVSRRHARLERRGESVIITDLGSSNGTLVNGRLVEEADGSVRAGMLPKLEESFRVLAAGRVPAVHIAALSTPDALRRELAEPGSVGTVLLP